MKPALAQVSTLAAAFEDDVVDYASAGCRVIEIWLTKLEDYVTAHSVDAARDLLAANHITAPVASFQGGLFDPDEAAREQHWQLFGRRLELCEQLAIGTLVVALDLERPASEETLGQYLAQLAQAGEVAARHDVRLACEFQAGRAFANNLQTAVALVTDMAAAKCGAVS